MYLSAAEEAQLEAYALDPASLRSSQRKRVEELVAQRRDLQQYVAFLKDFYGSVRSGDQTPSTRAGAFINALFSDTAVIQLAPDGNHAESIMPGILADGRVDPADPRLATLCALASRDHDVLVRVLIETETGACRLYTVAAEPGLTPHALFALSCAPHLVVADAQGRASFTAPPGTAAGDEDEMHGSMHAAVAEERLSRDQKHALIHRGEEIAIRPLSFDGPVLVASTRAGLRLTYDRSSEARALAYATYTAGGRTEEATVVAPFEHGVASFEDVRVDPKAVFRFYY